MPSEKTQLTRAEQRRADTEAQLVRSAAEVFGRLGYHATRVSDIAEEAGVGQGTFYRYFEDKRDVLDAVVASMMERLGKVFEDNNAAEQINDLAEYRARAADIATKAFDLIAVEHRSVGFLMRELPSIDERAVSGMSGLTDLMHTVIEQYYVVGIRRGYFRADLDTDAAATGVLGLGLIAVWSILRDPEDQEFRRRYGDTVVDFIVRHAVKDLTEVTQP
ncbi:TetR/AcrR family transcriptional regulator [Antrihabitans stalactiti]|uniref:TetR/AcrR family transcriptional regulator n=1 Tax=Antrihabitans stalactiti TaxID=2584121 RepID=A0A848KF52_9NOCA|nr:TetR/AcrR family transcriptional regulator [Antrihabitans stalactiti]NMN96366.1 TetR/AcrR family transcriptional regulator [Antrihabitans stalactiti]